MYTPVSIYWSSMNKKLFMIFLMGALSLLCLGCVAHGNKETGNNGFHLLGVPVVVDAELNFIVSNDGSKKMLFNSLIRITTTDGSDLPLGFRLNQIALTFDNITYNVLTTDFLLPGSDDFHDSMVIFITGKSLFNSTDTTTADIRFDIEEGDGTSTNVISKHHTMNEIVFNSYLKYGNRSFDGLEIFKPINKTPHFYVNSLVDLSLLPSSIATILTFYYGDEQKETDVMNGMFQYGVQESIRKHNAFSLHDAASYLQEIGYSSAGYTEDASVEYGWFNKHQEAIPFIVSMRLYNRGLFSVIKGFDENFVYMSISSMGNIAMTFEEFNNCFGDLFFLECEETFAH